MFLWYLLFFFYIIKNTKKEKENMVNYKILQPVILELSKFLGVLGKLFPCNIIMSRWANPSWFWPVLVKATWEIFWRNKTPLGQLIKRASAIYVKDFWVYSLPSFADPWCWFPAHNRLAMPICQIRQGFVAEEEKRSLDSTEEGRKVRSPIFIGKLEL